MHILENVMVADMHRRSQYREDLGSTYSKWTASFLPWLPRNSRIIPRVIFNAKGCFSELSRMRLICSNILQQDSNSKL